MTVEDWEEMCTCTLCHRTYSMPVPMNAAGERVCHQCEQDPETSYTGAEDMEE